MASAERITSAVQAWRDRLITAREAEELVGVDTEADLISIARFAREAPAAGRFSGAENNVRPFPVRQPGFAPTSGRDNRAINQSRR